MKRALPWGAAAVLLIIGGVGCVAPGVDSPGGIFKFVNEEAVVSPNGAAETQAYEGAQVVFRQNDGEANPSLDGPPPPTPLADDSGGLDFNSGNRSAGPSTPAPSTPAPLAPHAEEVGSGRQGLSGAVPIAPPQADPYGQGYPPAQGYNPYAAGPNPYAPPQYAAYPQQPMQGGAEAGAANGYSEGCQNCQGGNCQGCNHCQGGYCHARGFGGRHGGYHDGEAHGIFGHCGHRLGACFGGCRGWLSGCLGRCRGGAAGMHEPKPYTGPYAGPSGPATGAVAYPYYTTRAPRDFLMNNPPPLGP
ncbi:hypothetical protein [Lignipirellula cremea]|uniref:Uncharacterized protein n=1 Tax=Lignipirellula cremea TaxID=2528010 RepID=A0A518DVY0_9BACT|nr:hypothetical protein [Lignipirellula cremea]QDU95984.1 hypothetical protein Pla8534_38030 [Lignipirellula cremea]